MLTLGLVPDREAPFRILLLGAHCDDIEIGCGGTLLRLLAEYPNLCFDWVVFASNPVRAREGEGVTHLFGNPGTTELPHTCCLGQPNHCDIRECVLSPSSCFACRACGTGETCASVGACCTPT